MSRRRTMAWLLLVALLLPILAACGGTTETTTTPSTAASVAAEPSVAASEAASLEASMEASMEASAEASEAASAEAGAEATATAAAGGDINIPMPISLDTPPDVPNAEEASQYGGVTLRHLGSTSGIGLESEQVLAKKFEADTGITVEIIPGPESATERYSQIQRFFQAQATDMDTMQIDVIWPGALAPHLVDLNPKLGEAAAQHYEAIVQNNTVDGKLVGMPWFADFGILWYRTDLLEKYGFDAPPETWTELEQMAKTIQDGERAEGNGNFWGFTFQGQSYEGLTCDALEWIASSGGGTMVDENGEITINNPEAAAILNQARGWVNTIAPPGVTTYQEPESLTVFQEGNAAFHRNWPYVWAVTQADGTPVQGKVGSAPLPHGEGGESVATVGGWQQAVSRYSQNQDAAIEWVRYVTSPEAQLWRQTLNAQPPTIPAVFEHPAFLEANPFLEPLADVQRVTRPSLALAENYNQGSTAIFQGVNQILTGQDAAQVLPRIEQQLQRLVR